MKEKRQPDIAIKWNAYAKQKEYQSTRGTEDKTDKLIDCHMYFLTDELEEILKRQQLPCGQNNPEDFCVGPPCPQHPGDGYCPYGQICCRKGP